MAPRQLFMGLTYLIPVVHSCLLNGIVSLDPKAESMLTADATLPIVDEAMVAGRKFNSATLKLSRLGTVTIMGTSNEQQMTKDGEQVSADIGGNNGRGFGKGTYGKKQCS